MYEENLSDKSKKLLLNNMTGDEIVSLYKREFLGINKECDKKFSFTNDTFETYNDNIV